MLPSEGLAQTQQTIGILRHSGTDPFVPFPESQSRLCSMARLLGFVLSLPQRNYHLPAPRGCVNHSTREWKGG
jgi:hypothetical protein